MAEPKKITLTLDAWERQTVNHAIALLFERWQKDAPTETGTRQLKDLMIRLTHAGLYWSQGVSSLSNRPCASRPFTGEAGRIPVSQEESHMAVTRKTRGPKLLEDMLNHVTPPPELPQSLVDRIAKDMARHGPRAVIEGMRNSLNERQPGASADTVEAYTKVALTLTEILKHWKA